MVQKDPLAESPDLVEAAPPLLGDYEVTSDPNLTLTHWSHRDCCAGFNALRTLVARVRKSPRLAQRLLYGVITYDDDDDADKVVCFDVLETIMKKKTALHSTWSDL